MKKKIIKNNNIEDNKFEEIILKSKKKISSKNIGKHRSLFRGTGMDFEELREYNQNDDIRHINWKVSAKMNDIYVNVFNEEKELNVSPFFLVSGNIYFGVDRQKQELMAEILALISFATTEQNDVLNVNFYSEKSKLKIEPSKKSQDVSNIIKKAINLKPLNHVLEYKNVVKYINKNIKKKSILFLIGDFLEENIDLSLLINYEVYVIIVRDKFEEEPKINENFTFTDLNKTSHDYKLNIDEINDYKLQMKEKDRLNFENFEANKIKYIKIYTYEDPFLKLNSLFTEVK